MPKFELISTNSFLITQEVSLGLANSKVKNAQFQYKYIHDKVLELL